MVDVLHTVDLGMCAHIVGNVFTVCIERNVWQGRNHDANSKRLNEELKLWYKGARVNSKIEGELKYDRLKTDSGYPKLKAKATVTRHMCEFALLLAEQYCRFDPRIIAVIIIRITFTIMNI